MKKTILTSCICALALSYSFNVQAKIYKWIDKNGVTHYSAQPPVTKKNSKTKVKNIEDEIRFAAGKHKPPASQNQTDKNSDSEEKPDNTDIAPPSKKLISYCKTQRENLASLKNNFRNTWKDENGKAKRLNQTERKAKIDYLVKSITEECEGV